MIAMTRAAGPLALSAACGLAGPAAAQGMGGYADSDYYYERYYEDGAFDESYAGSFSDGFYDEAAPDYSGGYGYPVREDADGDPGSRWADDDDFYDGSLYDDDWGTDLEWDYYDKGWYTIDATDQDRWYDDQRNFYGRGPDRDWYTSDPWFNDWYDSGLHEGSEAEHGRSEPGDQSWFDGRDWWQDR